MNNQIKGFRDFLLKGKSLELAIGVIIGAGFSKIIDSLVSDIIMPPVGLLLGKTDFSNWFIVIKAGKNGKPYHSLIAAMHDGATTINIGSVFNNIISFVLIGVCVYLVIILLNKLENLSPLKLESNVVNSKSCKYCCSKIDINAIKCPNCTSDLAN